MVTLSLELSSFRLQSTVTHPPPCMLRLSSTTRRLRAESPLVNPSPDRDTRECVFPADWSLRWTEHLPDRLAVRAAAIDITVTKRSRPRFACAFGESEITIGSLKLNLLSLANGTVCQSLRIIGPDKRPTAYTLSFEAVVEEACKIKLHPTDVFLRANVPQAYLVLEYPSSRSATTSDTVENDDNEFHWYKLPSLQMRASSLTKLAHSSIKVRVHTTHGSEPIAQATIPLHQIWAAFAHPNHPYHARFQLTNDISVSLLLTADSPPPNGQMVGGVTTDAAITGARPVIFGSEISDAGRVPRAPSTPVGWVLLVDTFGYRYYRNVRSGVNVWTVPPDEATSSAIRADNDRARECGYSPEKYGVFRNEDSRTWIHPAVQRVSIPAYDGDVQDVMSTLSQIQDESPRTSLSLSTLDASDLHPATFTRRLETTADESVPVEQRGRVVEMRWKLHPKQRYYENAGTEGHTLTTVQSGKKILRFGGSHGSGGMRTNTLASLNTETMKWRKITGSGVTPAARTGHGAVALGDDQSKLLIFGGSSPQGRRNDLHMFHVANETWSPVSCTGTPPAPRARMGMTATTDGNIALVFGGRSLYRYLGGKYYDAVFLNAFHAEQEQWIQMSPRGTLRPKPRSGCILQAINERHVLLYGGYDDGDRFYSDTFIFDLVSSSWQQLPYPDDGVYPPPRESHSSTMMGSQVLIYGGDSERGLRNDLHLFDVGRLRWTDPPTLVGQGPGRLCNGDMAAIDDSRAILVGGDNGWSMSGSTFSLDVSHRSALDVKGLKELARERGPDAGACVVCLDAKVDTMFLWCGHSVCCRACASMVKKVCPVCRKLFSDVVYNPFD